MAVLGEEAREMLLRCSGAISQAGVVLVVVLEGKMLVGGLKRV